MHHENSGRVIDPEMPGVAASISKFKMVLRQLRSTGRRHCNSNFDRSQPTRVLQWCDYWTIGRCCTEKHHWKDSIVLEPYSQLSVGILCNFWYKFAIIQPALEFLDFFNDIHRRDRFSPRCAHRSRIFRPLGVPMDKAVAIANNDTVFLSWGYDQKISDCLGFALYRKDAVGRN